MKDISSQIYFVQNGTELTTMLGEWPVSKGKGAVIEADLKDAHMLHVSYSLVFGETPGIGNLQEFNEHIPDFTHLWSTVPGLRTKSFTVLDGTTSGSGIYCFKTKAAMDTYMKSDLFNSLKSFPHLKNIKIETYRVLEGGWITTEINKWPKAM